MQKRVVITGVGILSPIGIGREKYWESLRNGKNGIRKITLFDDQIYQSKYAGEIFNLKISDYFNTRELVNYDRATSLLLIAARLAIQDANLKITEENTNTIGVSVGTAFGSLSSLSEFDKESVIKGPHLVNPSHFPSTVANLPASHVSIYFNIKGFNSTISTGSCSSLDAIYYAVKAIKDKNKKVVLVGSVEEMCEHTFLGFYKLGELTKSNLSQPFSANRDGMIFSEGSGVLILEDLEHAISRQVTILGEIGGFGSTYDPYKIHKFNPIGIGMEKSMSLALERARIDISQLDLINANANSTIDADLVEIKALKKKFGNLLRKLPVISIKGMIGDSFSAAGIMAVIASIGSIYQKFIPPNINLEELSDEFKDILLPKESIVQDTKNVLINSFSKNGACSSLVIKKFI